MCRCSAATDGSCRHRRYLVLSGSESNRSVVVRSCSFAPFYVARGATTRDSNVIIPVETVTPPCQRTSFDYGAEGAAGQPGQRDCSDTIVRAGVRGRRRSQCASEQREQTAAHARGDVTRGHTSWWGRRHVRGSPRVTACAASCAGGPGCDIPGAIFSWWASAAR